MSAKYNLTLDQATTFNFQFQIKNDSTPWDLTNYTATMTNGYITLDGLNGRVTVTVPASVTEPIAVGRYSYDLVLDSGTVVTRILEGKLAVTGAVTL
jgi:hypothetical protein